MPSSAQLFVPCHVLHIHTCRISSSLLVAVVIVTDVVCFSRRRCRVGSPPCCATSRVCQDSGACIARAFKVSKASPAKVRDSIAEYSCDSVDKVLQQRLAEAVTKPWSHCIFNLFHDETRFDVVVPGAGLNVYSVMSQHALLLWKDDRNTHIEELIAPLAALEVATAETMLTCIRERFPVLQQFLSSARRAVREPSDDLSKPHIRYSALAISADSCPANIRFAAAVLNSLGPEYLGLFVRCLQHQTALVISPTTTKLHIVCPLFCIIKQLHDGRTFRGLQGEIDRLIEDRLNWKLPQEFPNPAHRAGAESLLEYVYFAINLQTDAMTVEEKDKAGINDANRRAYGRQLLSAFTGDWADGVIGGGMCHHCIVVDGRRCCQSRADAVQKCKDAIANLFKRKLEVPALNRWLGVFPCAGFIALLLGLHGLLREGYRGLLGLLPVAQACEHVICFVLGLVLLSQIALTLYTHRHL